MICFFFFQKDIDIIHSDCGQRYKFEFNSTTTLENNQMKMGNIFFSTPSNYQALLSQVPEPDREYVKVIKSEVLTELPSFPQQFDGNFEETILPFKGKDEPIKICVINAMSNAFGDHLIGMRAFNIFYDKLLEHFPSEKIVISFFQLNPVRLKPITDQWKDRINNLFILPATFDKLITHDLMVDLGGIVMQEHFDSLPMIDFFLEKLAIDYQSVPLEEKRMQFTLTKEAKEEGERIAKQLRKGRPILLIHPLASSLVRSMDQPNCIRIIREIIQKTEYLVVSCIYTELKHPRFINLFRMCNKDIMTFVSIISQVDAIVTVDTSTYHFADAFNIPTVSLFSTIDPQFRLRYYPTVNGILLEKKGGRIYGRHKESKKEQNNVELVKYCRRVWNRVNVDDILYILGN